MDTKKKNTSHFTKTGVPSILGDETLTMQFILIHTKLELCANTTLEKVPLKSITFSSSALTAEVTNMCAGGKHTRSLNSRCLKENISYLHNG